jgi:RNA polymerase sigma-70 factor (ECF subfamily)
VTDHRSDEELMVAYQRGDKNAFAELFRRWSPRLTRLLKRDLGRAEDAHDLMQQTFLQLHRARRDFRPDGKLRPWLYTIALNLKRQHFRRIGRRPESSIEDAAHDPAAPDAAPDARIADAQLRTALDVLPQAQREVIVLHWFEGLSFKEVAEVVGASQSAVKVRAHRGYAKLREVLVQRGVTPGPGAAYVGS